MSENLSQVSAEQSISLRKRERIAIDPEARLEQLDTELRVLDRENLELTDALLDRYTDLIRLLDKKSPLKIKVTERMKELRAIRTTLVDAIKAAEMEHRPAETLALHEELKTKILERDFDKFESVLAKLHEFQSSIPETQQAAFTDFYARITERFNEQQSRILQAGDRATMVTQFRGMTFELSRIVRVLSQGEEQLDYSKLGIDLRVAYDGYSNKEVDYSEPPTQRKTERIKEGGKTVERGVPIDFDVPIVRDGEPYIYETKSYPRKAFGEAVQVRNQALKYQAAIDQGLVSGATIEVTGRVDVPFLVWAMGSKIEDRGAIPGVEIVYTMPLPSGKEYRFVLKRGLGLDEQGFAIDNGLDIYNEERFDPEDMRVINGIQRAIVEHPGSRNSIISILGETLVPPEAHQDAFREMFPEPVASIGEFKQAIAKLFDYDSSDALRAGRVIKQVLERKKYTFDENQAVADLGELVSVDPYDQPQQALEALWAYCFENPGHITSSEVFDVYDQLRNEAMQQRFREQKVVINKENTKSAVSEYANPAYIEGEIRTFIDYLNKNPKIAAAKRHYLLPESKIPFAVQKAMARVERIAAFERARAGSEEEEFARAKREQMGYLGRPEGVALDMEHIILDTIYGINKNGIDLAEAEAIKQDIGKKRRKGDTPESIEQRVKQVFDVFFKETDDSERVAPIYRGISELEAAIANNPFVRDAYNNLDKRAQNAIRKICQEAILTRDYNWVERFDTIENFIQTLDQEDRHYQEIHIFDPVDGKVNKQTDTNDEDIYRTKMNIVKENIRRARAYMEETGRTESHKHVITKINARLKELESERDVKMNEAQTTAKEQAKSINEDMSNLRKEQNKLYKQSELPGSEGEAAKQRLTEIDKEITKLNDARALVFGQTRKVSAEYQALMDEQYIELEGIYKRSVPKDSWEQFAQKIVYEKDENIMKVIYVVTASGEIMVQEEIVRGELTGRAAHSELGQGQNCFGAGEMLFEKRDGKWVLVETNNGSGHYRPDANDTLPYVGNLLREKGIDTSSMHSIDAILRGRKLREASLF